MIENILGWICEDLGTTLRHYPNIFLPYFFFIGQPNLFTFHSLQYLLLSLKNNISSTEVKAWPTISVSKLQLEKDMYDYTNGIACDVSS